MLKHISIFWYYLALDEPVMPKIYLLGLLWPYTWSTYQAPHWELDLCPEPGALQWYRNTYTPVPGGSTYVLVSLLNGMPICGQFLVVWTPLR